jgi:hypothetical protein
MRSSTRTQTPPSTSPRCICYSVAAKWGQAGPGSICQRWKMWRRKRERLTVILSRTRSSDSFKKKATGGTRVPLYPNPTPHPFLHWVKKPQHRPLPAMKPATGAAMQEKLPAPRAMQVNEPATGALQEIQRTTVGGRCRCGPRCRFTYRLVSSWGFSKGRWSGCAYHGRSIGEGRSRFGQQGQRVCLRRAPAAADEKGRQQVRDRSSRTAVHAVRGSWLRGGARGKICTQLCSINLHAVVCLGFPIRSVNFCTVYVISVPVPCLGVLF